MNEIRKADATLIKFLLAVKPRPGIIYIPSQFALTMELEGKQYIYNTMTGQCLEAALPEKAQAGDGHDDLIESLFLVPENKDEASFYQSVSAIIRAYEIKKGVRNFTILPTLCCNARCVYCYEEGMEPVSMTPEIAEQTIRYILENKGKGKIKLSWFGGEPLLGVQVIDRICAAMAEAGIEYESSMVSNGSLITEEIIRKMTGPWKLKDIQISMDGIEQDYIARKQYYTYCDTYHRVINSVYKMAEAGIPVAIRCNVDTRNWDGVEKFFRDLDAGIPQKKNVTVYLCPLNDVRLGQDALPLWTKIIESRSQIQALGFGIQTGNGTGCGMRVNHCMADSGNVVITPDGMLYPCEHCPDESRFGDIFQGVTDQAARTAFCRVDRLREKCRKCPYLPECTAFATCPVQDLACREVRELLERDFLKMMIEHHIQEKSEHGENSFC